MISGRRFHKWGVFARYEHPGTYKGVPGLRSHHKSETAALRAAKLLQGHKFHYITVRRIGRTEHEL